MTDLPAICCNIEEMPWGSPIREAANSFAHKQRKRHLLSRYAQDGTPEGRDPLPDFDPMDFTLH
jgi:hypothetical protein